MAKLRVLYFGSGGGKGVTHMMVNLAVGHARGGRVEPCIVFRRKRGPLAEVFCRQLKEAGVAYREVQPRPRSATMAQLGDAIREFRPDVVVGQGYPEHLRAREAGLEAGVPVLLQVEQNHERYKWLDLRRSKQLAACTDAIVAVSQAVAAHLRSLGLPADKLRVIYNAVRLDRFCSAARPFAEREPVVMSTARFGRQKDHATLLRAVALLRDRGRPVRLRMAGSGKRLQRWHARWLVYRLGLGNCVEFLGQRSDVPELVGRSRVFVLSTHFEGLPLGLIEAMASGCAVIGTRAPGVEELIEHGRTGFLAAPGDPAAMADCLEAALGAEGERCAAVAREETPGVCGLERITAEYENLFDELVAAKRAARGGAGG
ncbi:MAG: glycosyltransferase [Opitutaceae bacterium]|nr:glycosyltransferase [Opitutaceae bacterium]